MILSPNSDRLAAEGISSLRLVKGSKDGYKSKIKYAISYFKSKEDYKQFVDSENNLIIPLPFDAFKDLFGRLAVDTSLPKVYGGRKKTTSQTVARSVFVRDDDSEAEADDYCKDGIQSKKATISATTMGGYKSAIKNYYKDKKVAFEASDLKNGEQSLDVWLNDFINAYERNIANKKEDGIMKINEGKSAISYDGYGRLNLEFIKFKPPPKNNINWSAGILSLACSLLQLNLICRSEILDRLHTPHFDWHNDHLTITVVKQKKDQGGTSHGKEKHVYANPETPHLCPILGLALYIGNYYL